MADTERKLTTILAVDVVGFSEMMGRNESLTLEVLKSCRGIVEDSIGEHHGRIFGGAGDSLIAEFTSPLQAVVCANDFQKRIAERNRECPEDQRTVLVYLYVIWVEHSLIMSVRMWMMSILILWPQVPLLLIWTKMV